MTSIRIGLLAAAAATRLAGAAQALGDLAFVVEGELGVGAEVDLPQALLDAALASDLRGRCSAGRRGLLAPRRHRQDARRGRGGAEKLSSFHRFSPRVRHILCRRSAGRKADGAPL